VDECKPLMAGHAVTLEKGEGEAAPDYLAAADWYRRAGDAGHGQGLTLVHFSAQRKRFLWDRGCMKGLPWGCLGGV